MSNYTDVKSAAKLAFQHRQAIKNGDFTPFIPALAMAIAKDGLFDMVPIIGNFLGLFITVYLFIFLWGKGKWKVRIVIFALSLFDVIPAVNLVPFSTICVLYAFKQAKAAADEAKKALATGEVQNNSERIREYQMARAAAEAQEAVGEEQYQEASVPPSSYGNALARKVV